MFLAIAALLATACSQAADERGASADGAEKQAAMPGIAPTAAPGVAFSYRYSFILPKSRIAELQERHAQACEALGAERCRITGMRFRLMNAREAEAQLRFKLAPDIARRFGRAGVEAAQRAEGTLIDAEISGEDAGARIAAADRVERQARDDLARIERPDDRGAAGAARVAEAARLRQLLRENAEGRDADRDILAATPMTFDYASDDLAPGVGTPLRRALRQSGANFVEGASLLLVIVITLLPWALALALIAFLVRVVRRRLARASRQTEAFLTE